MIVSEEYVLVNLERLTKVFKFAPKLAIDNLGKYTIETFR